MVLRCLGVTILLFALLIPGLRWAVPKILFTSSSAPSSHPRFAWKLEPTLRSLHVRNLAVPVFFDSGRIDYLENQFKHLDDDIWVTTYAKVGTTWTQYIVTRVLGYESISDTLDLFKISPWPEAVHGLIGVTNDELERSEWSKGRPRVFKSHWTRSDHMLKIPNSSKIVYVYRDAEKVAVSFYHHILDKYGMYQVEPEDLTWDRFFEKFVTGDMEFGDYFEHVASWWKVHDQPNILFVRFEDLKKKTKETISEIAKFIGKPTSSERLDAIVEETSLKSMKAWESGPVISVFKFFGVFRGDHIRTGGGTEQLMTDEQRERLKIRYREVLEPLGVPYEHMFSH